MHTMVLILHLSDGVIQLGDFTKVGVSIVEVENNSSSRSMPVFAGCMMEQYFA